MQEKNRQTLVQSRCKIILWVQVLYLPLKLIYTTENTLLPLLPPPLHTTTSDYSLSLIPGQGGSPPQSIPRSSRGVADLLWSCLLATCLSWPDREPDIGTPDIQLFLRRLDSVDRWPSPGARCGAGKLLPAENAYLCHRDALIPGPILLPTLVTVLTAYILLYGPSHVDRWGTYPQRCSTAAI